MKIPSEFNKTCCTEMATVLIAVFLLCFLSKGMCGCFFGVKEVKNGFKKTEIKLERRNSLALRGVLWFVLKF